MLMPEKGLHLRSWWTCNKTPLNEFNQFKLSSYRPKRLVKKSYLAELNHLLANLIYAANVGRYVIYIRDTKGSGSVTNRIIDWMTDCGMVHHVKGQRNQFKGIASRVWLTEQTKLDFTRRKVEVQLAKGIPFIQLRDANKKTVSLPSKPTLIKQLNAPCEAMNRLWLQNDAVFSDTDEPVTPFLHRSFNESFDFGGRFYFPSQTEPSQRRDSILINGESTVELDYKAIHFNLLYADIGLQFTGDPYVTEGYDRKVIKLAMLSFLNCEHRAAWCANITRSGNPDNAHMKGFIDGMPLDVQGKNLAAAIDERHAPIADQFHKTKIGIRLQRRDSEIMSICLLECSKLNIPVLPYHDGIRCPESAKEGVYKIMKDAYKQVTGFEIVVEVS